MEHLEQAEALDFDFQWAFYIHSAQVLELGTHLTQPSNIIAVHKLHAYINHFRNLLDTFCCCCCFGFWAKVKLKVTALYIKHSFTSQHSHEQTMGLKLDGSFAIKCILFRTRVQESFWLQFDSFTFFWPAYLLYSTKARGEKRRQQYRRGPSASALLSPHHLWVEHPKTYRVLVM